MSNRKKEVQSGSNNPAEKFIEWSSKNKCLMYYDKDKSENVLINLPFTFLYLADRSTVKGFDDADNTGIYSNEVKTMKDTMEVKNFKGKNIARGLWNDISAQVDKAGGKFAKSIYAMTKKGTLINVTLFGGALGEWFEFTKKSKRRLTDEWVTITGFEERKKGATTYFVPVFSYNRSLNDEQGEMADKAYEIFEEFEQGINPRKQEVAEQTTEEVPTEYATEPAPTPPASEEEDLDF